MAVIFRSNFKVTVQDSSASGTYTQFEYVNHVVSVEKDSIYLGIVYRPPPLALNGLSVNEFLREWDT